MGAAHDRFHDLVGEQFVEIRLVPETRGIRAFFGEGEWWHHTRLYGAKPDIIPGLAILRLKRWQAPDRSGGGFACRPDDALRRQMDGHPRADALGAGDLKAAAMEDDEASG